MTTHSNAYGMYDMGDGLMQNEVASTSNVMHKLKGKYEPCAVRINDVGYDKHKEELRITVEKIDHGSNYQFIFYSQDAIKGFLDKNGVYKIEDLKGERLTAFFVDNELQWLIPSSIPRKQDEKLEVILGNKKTFPKRRVGKLEKKFRKYNEHVHNTFNFIRDGLTRSMELDDLADMRKSIQYGIDEMIAENETYIDLTNQPQAHPEYAEAIICAQMARKELDHNIFEREKQAQR